jgi:DNA-binding CsgD family transcriptional regulator/catechol 2,3-dioxygenase-like lactoylglutathione lyase family enzyme
MSNRRRGRPPHPDVLTPAEWRTVHAVQHGMTSRDIARRRGISVDAVKFHVTNALAKLGLANRAALRRWFAVPRDSALYRREARMEVPLMLGPIGQISRSVRDVEAAKAFYGGVLGLPHLYTFGKLAFFDCGGTRLLLEQRDEPGPESVIYLRVGDIAAAHRELEARGVAFAGPPHMIYRHADGTEEWMAFFDDPEGRPLAIMAQVR